MDAEEAAGEKRYENTKEELKAMIREARTKFDTLSVEFKD